MEDITVEIILVAVLFTIPLLSMTVVHGYDKLQKSRCIINTKAVNAVVINKTISLKSSSSLRDPWTQEHKVIIQYCDIQVSLSDMQLYESVKIKDTIPMHLTTYTFKDGRVYKTELRLIDQ